MQIPIDFSDLPVREKYLIDENRYLSEWFIFGIHPETGLVDIWTEPSGIDIFTNVPENKAKELIKARHDFCQEIVRICNAR